MESYVATGKGGTGFVGPDATKLYAAMTVTRAIRFYLRTGLSVNRAYTPKNMRLFASNLCGKSYPRGKGGLVLAATDLQQWIAAMNAAIPVVNE